MSAGRCQVSCKAAGKPGEALAMATEPLPMALGWGEVLVNVRAAPVRRRHDAVILRHFDLLLRATSSGWGMLPDIPL